MERILVIGAGFLGQQIITDVADSTKSVLGTIFSSKINGEKIDIRKMDSVTRCVDKFNPDLIINCAANVNLDFLENNPDLAFSINSEGAKNVALIAKKNVLNLFISQLMVFLMVQRVCILKMIHQTRSMSMENQNY